MRLFIAIPLPESILRDISALQEEMKSFFTGKEIRWVPVQNMHLTIKFLGGSDPADIEKIHAVMSDSAGGIDPFEVEVKGTGVFPSSRSPRVLWVGCIEKNSFIINIKNNMENKLVKMGYKKEKGRIPVISQ
jgi:2'-5' RNA ligase